MTSRFLVGAVSTAANDLATHALAQLLLPSQAGTSWLQNWIGSTPCRRDDHTPLLAFTRMLSQAAEESGRHQLGLEMAAFDAEPTESIFGELLASAPTLGDALEALAHYFPVGQTATAVELTQVHGMAYLSYQIRDPAVTSEHRLHDAVYTLGKVTRALRRILGGRWQLAQVSLGVPRPIEIEVYRRFFQAQVVFGGHATGFQFSAADLDRPIPTGNSDRYRIARAQLDAKMPELREVTLLREALKTWIGYATLDGRATLEQAASDFGVTPRTLQRRLKEQELGFQELLTEFRMDTARRMLTESRMPVTSIAQQLGYSETSAFTRAFRIHARVSPRAFRHATHGAS